MKLQKNLSDKQNARISQTVKNEKYRYESIKIVSISVSLRRIILEKNANENILHEKIYCILIQCLLIE